MEAIILTDLFKGTQKEEVSAYYDLEHPSNDPNNWKQKRNGIWEKTNCNVAKMMHYWMTDRVREVVDDKRLLPSYFCVQFAENVVATPSDVHIHDSSLPQDYVVEYNHYTQNRWETQVNGEFYNIANETALLYSGSQEHMAMSYNGGIALRIKFYFSYPDNYFYIIGEHQQSGKITVPSQRDVNELKKDWF